MGIFSHAQGQLTLQSVVGSGRILNSSELSCMSSLGQNFFIFRFTGSFGKKGCRKGAIKIKMKKKTISNAY